ncbi:MAG: guanylate kinase [Actinobacteria bacterium]|nr:guanylate kinase [Actinomycetota bacterium]
MAKLIVISGPSGAGKGTLIARVLPHFRDLVVSVSATTRPRRAGEREGREYFFMGREEFLRRVEAGAFLEWAEYGGNLYGTPEAPVRTHLEAGRDVILEIELQGARQIRERVRDAVLVFIAPPDLQELEQRLRRRNTESEEAIAKRMDHAREEMDELARDMLRESREFHYVIVNEDVDVAAEALIGVIEDIRKNDPERWPPA